MEAIYKLNFSAGRMGNLEGIFVADKEKVNELITSKTEVYFGEVLGKYSDIYGPIEPSECTMVSDDPAHVDLVKSLKMECGFNPFNYIEENEEDEGAE